MSRSTRRPHHLPPPSRGAPAGRDPLGAAHIRTGSPRLRRAWLGRANPVLPRHAPAALAPARGAAVRLRPAAAPLPHPAPRRAAWALDSGGFTELQTYGRWDHGPPRPSMWPGSAATATRSAGWRGRRRRTGCANRVIADRRTGLTVAEHQHRTVDQLPASCATWPRTCRSSRSCRAGPGRLPALRRPVRRRRGRPGHRRAGRGRVGVPPPGHRRGRAHPDRPAPGRRGPAARLRRQNPRPGPLRAPARLGRLDGLVRRTPAVDPPARLHRTATAPTAPATPCAGAAASSPHRPPAAANPPCSTWPGSGGRHDHQPPLTRFGPHRRWSCAPLAPTCGRRPSPAPPRPTSTPGCAHVHPAAGCTRPIRLAGPSTPSTPPPAGSWPPSTPPTCPTG